MSEYPPLPEITGTDLVLDVYTHPSLSAQPNEEYGNSRRLAFLGSTAFNQAVAFHCFIKNRQWTVEEIEEYCRPDNISNMMTRWYHHYNIASRFRFVPDLANRMGSPEEIERFFHTFVGALFISSGPKEVQDWISRLLDPESPPPPLPERPSRQQAPTTQSGFAQPGLSSQPPPPPGSPPPAPPEYYPPTNTASTLNGAAQHTVQILATFNQTAQNRGYHVNYTAQATGPPHLPVWTVKCLLNGEEKGEGQGKSQKVAKEMAARMAWQSMGWGPLPM